ncbi:hypothetical protein PPTG_21033 [Phytophthora nicotianae INRA-310]|uniref:Uncharacterized protein n=3 Tax=Phytophthora nicotianae TaxID=4792 RepID=W2R8U9_PHYN3|nr:hypothetical protein PPTG_21033 [Phytophthora nicotianae INRA-310]ETN20955.1 hypothetical protein PPTG_21033 [Phytophthora nicotianae INRA-310]
MQGIQHFALPGYTARNDTKRNMGAEMTKLWRVRTVLDRRIYLPSDSSGMGGRDQIDTYAQQAVPPSKFDAISTSSSDVPSEPRVIQEMCTSVNVKFIAPELDCVAGWKSTLTMLASAEEFPENTANYGLVKNEGPMYSSEIYTISI